MEGFEPEKSFGYDVSKRYDAVGIRGDEEQTVVFLAQLAGGRNALEFAVGTGRIALSLTAAGVRVDGIEMSQHMVDRMHEKPDGDNVEVTIGDMSRVTTGRTYRLVYLVYNTIGNLLTQDDQVRCFENAARHLTEEGVFVLECRVPTAPSRPGLPVCRRRSRRGRPRHAGRLPVRPGHPDPRREPRPDQHRRHRPQPNPPAPRPPTRVRPDGPRRRPSTTRPMGRLERRTVHRQ